MNNGLLGLIVVLLIIVLAVVVIAKTIRVIQQGSVGVVKRLGQFHAVRNPGITFLLPFADIMELVDMRETPRTGDRQDVITKDNVSVQVNATIFSQVVDPQAALFGVSDYHVAVDQLARASLRAVLGEMTLDEALSQREAINAKLQARMESETDKWGVRINRVEIIDIVPPAQILQAMAKQKEADQEKRAAILKSEGEQQSQINVAQGQKQAQILEAEGKKAAQILFAEGQKQAQVLEADGRAAAIGAVYGAINRGNPNPELLAVLQLDTLQKFASSPNSKVLVPYESMGLLGAAQALRSVLDGVPVADRKAPLGPDGTS
jgi:regulator of protease activity HflC (stomatin/prohibitin superfamily)